MSGFGTRPERRAFGRRSATDRAVIRVPGRPPIYCIVRNIGEGGAYVELTEPAYLPFTFRLSWAGGAREEECEIRHTNGRSVGVYFKRQEQPKPGANAGSSDINDISAWLPDGHHRTR